MTRKVRCVTLVIVDSSRHIIRIDADAWTDESESSKSGAPVEKVSSKGDDDDGRKCRKRSGTLLLLSL